MAGTAARPTVLGSGTQLKIFAAQGLPENFKYFWVRQAKLGKGGRDDLKPFVGTRRVTNPAR
jgi:hypothetical protein